MTGWSSLRQSKTSKCVSNFTGYWHIHYYLIIAIDYYWTSDKNELVGRNSPIEKFSTVFIVYYKHYSNEYIVTLASG